MKKKIAFLFLVMLMAVSCASASVKAKLTAKMATRSGPGTNYTELGTYFSSGKSVTAVSKYFDSKNRVWWVQVEFKYGDTYRRAYTGRKRLSVSLGKLPEEKKLYKAALIQSTVPHYGPGEQFAAYGKKLSSGMMGSVYAEEDGWVQFEYKSDGKLLHRVWVPTENVEAISYEDTAEESESVD